jgi:protein phosphatase
MQLTVASRSEQGPVRQNNEDFVAFWEPEGLEEKRERGALAIIADGVGGHGDGEVASRMAVEVALETFQSLDRGASMQSMLAQAVI